VVKTVGILGIEIAGVDHDVVDLAIYAIGWTLGWLLLWSPRHLPLTATSERAPVAVIVPARDESASLAHLLEPLVAQRRPGDQIVVVDDHSTDDTGAIADRFGVEVTLPPRLDRGWSGKPNACWHGVGVTDAPTLVFLDADVRPGPTLLDDLASRVDHDPGRLVSVQPWHDMETASEQPSALFSITALMGCGAFTIVGPRAGAKVAFGPVIAVDRQSYLASGGHAADTVRNAHTEDIALARAMGRSELFVGAPDRTTFRMYPSGLRELSRGWTRSIATGARSTRWIIALATLGWVWSVAGGWIAVPIVYPLTALQVWVLGRRAGRVHPITAALFPLLVIVFAAVFLRSLHAVAFRRDVTWKGRRVGTRAG